MTTVGGFAAPGFERVAEVMGDGARVSMVSGAGAGRSRVGGGAFAAFVDGECVVDVWSGLGRPGVGCGRKIRVR